MNKTIEPFYLSVSQSVLDDLHARLAAVRWPDRETVSDWSQGVPLDHIRALTDYWKDEYDWRRCEAMLNGHGQFRTQIDGLGIHFLHIRSPEPNAMPLVMTHGWPGSIIEFNKVIGPLSDPVAYGGDARDAFHLIIPSLPGYGLSDKPTETGWGMHRIARAWRELVARLGYTRYCAQGGDWGAAVTTALGTMQPEGLAAIHLNFPFVLPDEPHENLSDAERQMVADIERYSKSDSGYAIQQRSRPQTLGYALADSPVGQAAWIYEKLRSWSDCAGDPRNIFSLDEMLDNIMLYWLTNSATSSARLYWESNSRGFRAIQLNIPTGCSIFPKEIYRAPRSWADRCIPNIIHWNELERGGHFAAFEQPVLFVDEIRTCFRKIR